MKFWLVLVFSGICILYYCNLQLRMMRYELKELQIIQELINSCENGMDIVYNFEHFASGCEVDLLIRNIWAEFAHYFSIEFDEVTHDKISLNS